MTMPINSPQSSQYISVFSNRYSAHPHDGDDSDDEEHGQTSYTVIENDWRGGHVIDSEGFKKAGRWGHFKDAIGKVGRRDDGGKVVRR